MLTDNGHMVIEIAKGNSKSQSKCNFNDAYSILRPKRINLNRYQVMAHFQVTKGYKMSAATPFLFC